MGLTIRDRPIATGQSPLDPPGQAAVSRRMLLAGVAAWGVGLAARSLGGEPAAHAGAHAVPEITPQEAIKRLKEGNERFVEEHARHEHTSRDWRRSLLSEQHPFAVIVGCSDSRVPPELIFDQGFGDLFVIRNAGNLVATDVLASIEYAAIHLNTRLVVIMGHEACGAVSAAIQTRQAREQEPMELQATLKMIDVALSAGESAPHGAQPVSAAVEQNVRWGVRQLNFLSAERGSAALGSAKIVGAVYDLNSGRVRFLD